MAKDTRTVDQFKDDMRKAYDANKPRTEMDEDQFKFMMVTHNRLKENEFEDVCQDQVSGNELEQLLIKMADKSPQIKVLYGHLQAHNTRVTLASAISLIFFCNTPPEIVQIAHYMYYKCNGRPVITMEDVMSVFLHGIWSEEQKLALWRVQKREAHQPDNWINYSNAWFTE